MSYVVLDTDVASASFSGRLPGRFGAWLTTKTPCITFVTLGELTKWVEIRKWGPKRRTALASWRRHVAVLSYDDRVATTWGNLQARAQARGRPRPVNDTWIAACCIVDKLSLATFNTKDFADFAHYDGLKLVDVA